jgi:hypothetical protein
MSSYTDNGTAAHWVLERCLGAKYELGFPLPPESFIGQDIPIPADEDHAWLSPSAAKSWLACPKSAHLRMRYPEPKEGPRMVAFTAEDAEAVQVCLDYVAERVKTLAEASPDGVVKVYSERRVSPKEFLKTDMCDGTSDIFIHAPGLKFGEHIDYKHGAGVLVKASDPQNDLYLMGTLAAMGEDPIETAQLTIVQPRCGDIPVRSRTIAEVPRWLDGMIATAATAILNVHMFPERTAPSEDACRWCPGRGRGNGGAPLCEAYVTAGLQKAGVLQEQGLASAEDLWGTLRTYATLDPEKMDPAQLADICAAKSALLGALNAVEAYALKLLQEDSPPEALAARFEIGYTTPGRQYSLKEEDEIAAALGKIKITDPVNGKIRKLKKLEVYREVVKSPAQMEKTLKELGAGEVAVKAFERLVVKPQGNPKLVPKKTFARAPRPDAATALQDVSAEMSSLMSEPIFRPK